MDKGANPRYIVTNLPGEAKHLYEKLYCARGDMENRIKEQQLDLFADRTSAHKWWANQFRLLLASLAYILLETIRRVGLKGTELARAQAGTIRLKLLKIGAVIIRNTRRVHLMLASFYPFQAQNQRPSSKKPKTALLAAHKKRIQVPNSGKVTPAM